MRLSALTATALTLVLAGCLATSHESSQPPTITLQNLRTEYLTNPLGLDAPSPRLSWELSSNRRNVRQSAYQLLIASSPDQLNYDQANLWNTGKVLSSETTQIAYAGKPLTSRQPCWWKVRIWDENGIATPWSTPAHWEMGLLQPNDWHAQWLDASPLATPAPFKILYASYESLDSKTTKDVTDTLISLIHNDTLNITINNTTFGSDPTPKQHKQLRITYTLAGNSHEEILPEGNDLHLPPVVLPYLRKSFTTNSAIQSARLYVTARGLYEIRLNGQRVGDHLLAPDWTDYRKRITYQTYDVTSLLHSGNNALAALVADGWYAGHIGNGGLHFFGHSPSLLAQLEMTHTDGTITRITTDDTWKSHLSPLLSSDFMLGENYDATHEIPNWDGPSLDDTDWSPTKTVEAPAIPLEAQKQEPVVELMHLHPKSLAEPAPGHYVFDMAQNMVGVVRLKVSAPKGTVITFRHAEVLQPDGTLYTTNLRKAPSIDTYTCRGTGEEIWQPRFTFHGFRYIELTGLPTKPSLDAITGIVEGSATLPAGEFTCSDPRINQLQSNIQWGQRGNYLSVPTDCPQRDERLGWMGDAQVFIRTATYNADIAAFMTQWLDAVDDGQLPDGRYGDVSPNTMKGSGTPAWADAGVICPWTLYQVYGDKQLLQKHYPAMVRWVEFCQTHSNNLIRDKDLGSNYGDWLSINAKTPKDLIGTTYFAYVTHLLAQSAAVLGNTEDASKYETLFEQIKAAFNKQYVSLDGRITGNTQAVYDMALKFELLSPALQLKAAQYLEDDIHAKNNHLSTGFVGVSYLLPTLTNAGKLTTAYQLLLQDTFPSWLFSVKNGATTIWERWDGWTPDKGFQDPGMNSFNHYSLGSCGEWLFSDVAGIKLDPSHPGFSHFLLTPHLPPHGELTWAKATYHSIHGPIESGWSVDAAGTHFHVVIPANTTSSLFLPTSDRSRVLENNIPLAHAPDIDAIDVNGTLCCNLGSGTYDFTLTPPHP